MQDVLQLIGSTNNAQVVDVPIYRSKRHIVLQVPGAQPGVIDKSNADFTARKMIAQAGLQVKSVTQLDWWRGWSCKYHLDNGCAVELMCSQDNGYSLSEAPPTC